MNVLEDKQDRAACPSIEDFLDLVSTEDFAIIETPAHDLLFCIGPFTERENVPSSGCALYFNDFLLRESSPFLEPLRHYWLRASERPKFLELGRSCGDIEWTHTSAEMFLESFRYFSARIESGDLIKAVPVCFEFGSCSDISVRAIVGKLLCGQAGLYSYALKRGDRLLAGATPEMLFHYSSEKKLLTTEAVAGSILSSTTPLSAITGKLQEEHQVVVVDLVRQLSTIGTVEKGEIALKTLRSLSHLRTPLSAKLSRPFNFQKTIELLHPTGALGLLPRVPLSDPLIAALDPTGARNEFGAPFGVSFSDGDALALVMIRSIFVEGSRIRVGAGAGLTRQSEPKAELTEIQVKQQSIRDFFGL